MTKYKFIKYIMAVFIFGIILICSTNVFAENHIAYDSIWNFTFGEINWNTGDSEICVHINKGTLNGRAFCSKKGGELRDGLKDAYDHNVPREGRITITASSAMAQTITSTKIDVGGFGNSNVSQEAAQAAADADAARNALNGCNTAIDLAVSKIQSGLNADPPKQYESNTGDGAVNTNLLNQMESLGGKDGTESLYKSLEILKDQARTRRSNANGTLATFKGMPSGERRSRSNPATDSDGWPTWGKWGQSFNGFEEGMTYAFWGEFLDNKKENNSKFTWTEMQRAVREFTEWSNGTHNSDDMVQLNNATDDQTLSGAGSKIKLEETVATYNTFYDNSIKDKVSQKKELNVEGANSFARVSSANENGNYYLVGPFYLKYDQEVYEGILYSWIDSVEITTQIGKNAVDITNVSNINSNSIVQITNSKGELLSAKKMSIAEYDEDYGTDNIKKQGSETGIITEINAPQACSKNSGTEFYLKYTGKYVDDDKYGLINNELNINIKFKFKYIAGYEDKYDEGSGTYYTDAIEYNTRQHLWHWTWGKTIYEANWTGQETQIPLGNKEESENNNNIVNNEDNKDEEETPTPTPTPYFEAYSKATKSVTATVTIKGTKSGYLVCNNNHTGITQTIITSVKGRLKYGERDYELPFTDKPTPSPSPSTTPSPSPSTTPSPSPSTTPSPSPSPSTTPTPPILESEIKIEGTIWKDNPEEKSGKINGELDNNDTRLNGIEVWLYELTNTLSGTGSDYLKIPIKNAAGDIEEIYLKTADEYYLRLATLGNAGNGNTNPQLTRYLYNSDTKVYENGRYSFTNLSPFKKYIVVYKYDGMLYENTYGTQQAKYNTSDWAKTSKGSELVDVRDLLNNKFTTIQSMPASYVVSKQIFSDDDKYLTVKNGKKYNEIYNIKSEEAVYYRTKIREKIEEYLKTNSYLSEADYINKIYGEIVNKDTDKSKARKVLQFIYDCRTSAYSGCNSIQGGTTELTKASCAYPCYDKFVIYENNSMGLEAVFLDSVNLTRATANIEKQINGYHYIYSGQLYVNLGLVERPSTSLQVGETVKEVVVSINGKDATYKYYEDSESTDIIVQKSDYDIVHYISNNDYNYLTTSAQLASLLTNNIASYEDGYAKIELYITYKILIENKSNVKTAVNELVTYFDKNFLSYSNQYTTTAGNTISGITAKYFNNKIEGTYKDKQSDIGVNVYAESQCAKSDIYVNNSNLGMTNMTDLYFRLHKPDKQNEPILLDNNDQIFIYITYRLGENSTDNSKYNCTYKNGGNSAQNILQKELGNDPNKEIPLKPFTEINSYSTYIAQEQDRKSGSIIDRYRNKYSELLKGEYYRAAGYLDISSIPGNLNINEINNTQGFDNKWGINSEGYESGKIKIPPEFDWARPEAFILKKDQTPREILGNVWETEKFASEYIGNGLYPRYTGNQNVKGITVELIEINNIDDNGNKTDKKTYEHIRAVTETNQNGKYEFYGIIPGNYVVRFTYGDKAEYSDVQYSDYNKYSIGRQNFKYAYNGEFYQSAKANPNTNQEQYWYKDTNNRYSDASDEANIRMHVNNLLQNGYVYGNIAELTKRPTDYMVYAYTSLLEMEVEYATTEKVGGLNLGDKISNPGYSISNIDFALTPRTETKLKIDKEVSNIKLILQNGTVQFEATPETIREQGVPGVGQIENGGNIFISMADSIINGATIEITYKIRVTNDSDYDSVTYYKDKDDKVVAIGLYEESPEKIVFYENGEIRTYNNKKFQELKTISKDAYNGKENKTCTYTSLIKTGKTDLVTFASNKTSIIETTTTPSIVADYISNNLTFSKTNYTGATINSYWTKANESKDDIVAHYYNVFDKDRNLLPAMDDMNNKEAVYNNNEIVFATADNPLIANRLRSKQSSTAEIVLSKVISTENGLTDTKEYSNYIRVLGINNTVSRIQDITELWDKTETVLIGKPTGTTINYTLIILTFIAVTILAVGIVLIKKLVLNRR